MSTAISHQTRVQSGLINKNIEIRYGNRRARPKCVNDLRSARSSRRLHIIVVGAGPAGLSFATQLKLFLGDAVHITAIDHRLKQENGRFVWKDACDGLNRRIQIVTLQPAELNRLPAPLLKYLEAIRNCSKMWPIGGWSPPELGAPWNLSISDIEDALLSAAHEFGVKFCAKKVEPSEIDLEACDLLVIADGAQSKTRDYFQDAFGQADKSAYALNGEKVEDTILGLRVTSDLSDANAVALTIAQQRFLMNTQGGEGYIYMRCTRNEATEVRTVRPGASTFSACNQGHPARFGADESQVRFWPAEDPNSFLWQRIQEALQLFGVKPGGLHEVASFKLSMVRRARFTAELTEMGSKRPVFGALIGDSGLGIHFWPGRGMNAALSSAQSLARSVARRWSGKPLRSADFTEYEAAMAALQHRHQDRAWRNMVFPWEGRIMSYADAFAHILEEPALNVDQYRSILRQRIMRIVNGLQPRMPSTFDFEDIAARLDTLSPPTLRLFAECGGWETWMSGGPEVDLDQIVPTPDAPKFSSVA